MVKRGISLILIIIMVFIVIILGFVCTLVINNNSSFFNIKKYKALKEDLIREVNSVIYEYGESLGDGAKIIPGEITEAVDENKAPKLVNADEEVSILVSDFECLKDENLDNVHIYIDEFGKVTLKYLFFYV